MAVEDDGPGIEVGERDRVFERFYRASDYAHSGEGGYGLGLAIAKAIVVEHDGEIRIEARAEGGARAVVELPGFNLAASDFDLNPPALSVPLASPGRSPPASGSLRPRPRYRDGDCHAARRTIDALIHYRFHIDHTTLQVDHESDAVLKIAPIATP